MKSYWKSRLKVLLVFLACSGNIATGSTFLRHRVLPVGARSQEQEIALETIVEEDILNACILLAQDYFKDSDRNSTNMVFDGMVNQIEQRIKGVRSPREIVVIINKVV